MCDIDKSVLRSVIAKARWEARSKDMTPEERKLLIEMAVAEEFGISEEEASEVIQQDYLDMHEVMRAGKLKKSPDTNGATASTMLEEFERGFQAQIEEFQKRAEVMRAQLKQQIEAEKRAQENPYRDQNRPEFHRSKYLSVRNDPRSNNNRYRLTFLYPYTKTGERKEKSISYGSDLDVINRVADNLAGIFESLGW